VIFWISYLCWFLGSYAYIAQTPNKLAESGISWSLNLTPEAGFIVALVAGLIVGNFFPQFARWFQSAIRPEWYIKTGIVILGATLGVKAADQLGLFQAVMFRGLCAIVEAYLIYWAVVYFVARKFFKFPREWAVPLASGISICGVSAAIATGAAIKARPVIPIMVSSLVVIFAVVELLVLPFVAQAVLTEQPMVAGAWMGLAVKTDGAAVASGAIADSLICAKAAASGVRYEPGWIMGAAATVKVFIDVFIGVWAFVLAVIWCTTIEGTPGQGVPVGQIWQRFPKFVIGYMVTFLAVLLIAAPIARDVGKAKVALKDAKAANSAQVKSAEADAAAVTAKLDRVKGATGEADLFRGIFFVMTFFTIGLVSNFKKLWEEGIGKLAAVYVVCLFGFIIWVGLLISWIFFHGVQPPLLGA